MPSERGLNRKNFSLQTIKWDWAQDRFLKQVW